MFALHVGLLGKPLEFLIPSLCFCLSLPDSLIPLFKELLFLYHVRFQFSVLLNLSPEKYGFFLFLLGEILFEFHAEQGVYTLSAENVVGPQGTGLDHLGEADLTELALLGQLIVAVPRVLDLHLPDLEAHLVLLGLILFDFALGFKLTKVIIEVVKSVHTSATFKSVVYYSNQ